MISEDAQDMVKHLLCVDVEQRYSAAESLQHPWITGAAHNDSHKLPLDTMQHTMRARVERRKGKEEQQQQQALRTQEQFAKQAVVDQSTRTSKETDASGRV
jgi:serine/threonine protein kinase